MSDELGDTRKHYHAEGYVHLRNVATPEVTRGLAGLIRRDIMRPEALTQITRQPTISNKPAYEFYSYHYAPVLGFHLGLTSRMCQATGRPLAPSYAYFRLYQGGDVCKVHADKPSCEHSVSLPLAYADDKIWSFEIGRRRYEYPTATQMPIADDFGDEPFSSLELAPGDAVLYKGINHRHGRVTPNPNRWSAHLFMHWVDTEGPHKEWAFDKKAMPEPGEFPLPPAAMGRAPVRTES
jgi:hypothetical protein